MVLSQYNKNLLNFLYELTKVDCYVNHKQLSKKIRLDGQKRITYQTIQNWFRFLKQNDFCYSPVVQYEKLGLHTFFAMTDLSDKAVIKGIPFATDVFAVYNPIKMKKQFIMRYSVPVPLVEYFYDKWNELKKENPKISYKLFQTNTEFIIYTPFHKSITKEGSFDPRKIDKKDMAHQIERFYEYLKSLSKPEMDENVRKNPLFILVALEYINNGCSSVKLWNRLKSKLGENIWDYVKKKKTRTDNIGIKRVQSEIKRMNKKSNGLFHQLRIDYVPLTANLSTVHVSMKCKDKKEIKKIVSEIALKSVCMKVYPRDDNHIFLSIATNNHGIQEIIKQLSTADIMTKKILWEDDAATLAIKSEMSVTSNHFEYFNPRSSEWKKL